MWFSAQKKQLELKKIDFNNQKNKIFVFDYRFNDKSSFTSIVNCDPANAKSSICLLFKLSSTHF